MCQVFLLGSKSTHITPSTLLHTTVPQAHRRNPQTTKGITTHRPSQGETMAGGNNYNTYRARRKSEGRLRLEDQLHEDIVQYTAAGYSSEEVTDLVGQGAITLRDIET